MSSYQLKLALVLLLNIAFVGFIWHLDVNHNLEKLGVKKTKGIFKIDPNFAYRLSQYGLILVLVLIDLIFVFL